MAPETLEKSQNRSTRELDSRNTFSRPTTWQLPETLPAPDDRPGWEHRYIRISILGTSDATNISSKLREGYEPCKGEDYPELVMHANTEGRFKGNIEVGGLLLCRIPAEFVVQRNAHYARVTRAQTEAVDNNLMRQSDPRMPLFNERKSSTSFGKGS